MTRFRQTAQAEMMRLTAALALVVVVDGDMHEVPRDLQCLTTARGHPITLYLRGDGVFSDGFESAGLAVWRQPPGPCGK